MHDNIVIFLEILIYVLTDSTLIIGFYRVNYYRNSGHH